MGIGCPQIYDAVVFYCTYQNKLLMVNDDIDDTPGWRWNKGSMFTSKSAYELLSEEHGRGSDKQCRRCGRLGGHNGLEDIYHILRKCLPAASLWSRVVKNDRLNGFLALNLVDWIHANITRLEYFALNDDNWDVRPKSRWTKVNIDGARQLEKGYAASRGSIRDENGVWPSGFARNIEICSTIEVELRGIYDGLVLVMKM
ncbi:hypothetical protein GOBAR_DD10331 [Gossypium barbadense]|nr:hypothetical protein GOBAR_DD10331 [Gossypium barbadense]